MKIIAAVLESTVVERILTHLGLQARGSRTPTRGHIQQAAYWRPGANRKSLPAPAGWSRASSLPTCSGAFPLNRKAAGAAGGARAGRGVRAGQSCDRTSKGDGGIKGKRNGKKDKEGEAAGRAGWQSLSLATPAKAHPDEVKPRTAKASHPPRIGKARAVRLRSGPSSTTQSKVMSLVTRVYQLPWLTRVPPQEKAPLTYWTRVQLWPMYSLAIQMLLPSVAAAP